jgi:outer membrane protein TolC
MMRVAISACVLVTALPASAEDIALDAVVAAVDRAPTAVATGFDVAAAEARVDAADAWPVTSVHGGTNRLTARVVAGVTLPLPILGTLGAARDEAAAHATVVRADGSVARRELRRRAVIAWLELSRSDATVATLTTAAAQAAELERIAKGKLDAGTGGEVDVTSAHAARARADVAVAAAKRESAARAAELAAVLGWDPLRELHATGALPGGAADLEALRAALAQHPARAAELDRIAEHEASAHRVEVARRPGVSLDVQASFGDPTLPASGACTLSACTDVFAGLVLELPLFGRFGAQLDAIARDTDAERARLTALDAELAGGLVAAYRRWQAASEQLVALERDVAPAQEKASQLAAQAFREGARDLSTALQAARDLAAVRAEIANARVDAATAWIELELAAGKDAGAH